MNSTLPLKKAIFFPFVFVALTWLIHIVNWSLNGELVYFGTYPRTINHWYGILTGALIHGNFDHLISNTLPFLILGTLIFISYQNIAHKTFIFIYLFTGSAIFLFARTSFHVGSSGIVYGFASFLFFIGIFRHDTKSMALAAIVAIFYGGMVWGVLPLQNGVSWEGHLFGGIAGAIAAFYFRKEEITEVEKEKFEIENKTFEGFLKEKEQDFLNLEEKTSDFFGKLEDKIRD